MHREMRIRGIKKHVSVSIYGCTSLPRRGRHFVSSLLPNFGSLSDVVGRHLIVLSQNQVLRLLTR